MWAGERAVFVNAEPQSGEMPDSVRGCGLGVFAAMCMVFKGVHTDRCCASCFLTDGFRYYVHWLLVVLAVRPQSAARCTFSCFMQHACFLNLSTSLASVSYHMHVFLICDAPRMIFLLV